MGDAAIILLIFNSFIFSMIFWLVNFIGSYFFKSKETRTKLEFYECGFKSISDLNIQFNINFSIICVFLVLYDVEILLLLPGAINSSFVTYSEFFIISLFVLLIILSLYYDTLVNALAWQI